MHTPDEPSSETPSWMAEGGACGALMRATDWDATALGPTATWPTSLTTTVGTLLRSRHPMFLWWGPELVQVYNDAYVPSFGIGKHPRAMGQRGADCWPEIWPIIAPQIEDVMQRGIPSFHEDHLVPIYRNGRIEDVYWTYGYSPVLDDEGHIGGTLVVCTETTARVLVARRLELLHALAEACASCRSRDGVFAALAGALATASADVPFAILTARTQDGVSAVVQTVGIDHPEVAAAFPGDLRALERAAGTVVPVQGREGVSGAYVANVAGPSSARGQLVFGVSDRLPFDEHYRKLLEQIASQVTHVLARLDAAAAHAAVERERDNLLMQAPVAISIITGPEHVYELVNARYRAMIDRDVVGKRFVEAFPEVSLTELPQILDRVYATGEPFAADEQRTMLDRGDGVLEERYFRFNIEPIRDATGRVYGMMTCSMDITAQVRARHELERTHEERKTLLAELEAANRAKDEFLAMLGHELRNPLSPIVTALELMKLADVGEIPKEREIIERQVKHLLRLVDDLLDISRITRGKVELVREVVALADIAEKAVEMASVLFEERGHTLHVDVPLDAYWEGDATRLAQVVANLLTNAARYTSPGGNVVVSTRVEGEDLALCVRDDGVGIAEDMLPRIFDLFVQGPRRPDRSEGGLGIGLTIARNLVHLHGGSIAAQSEGPGRGSTFVVRLRSASPGFTEPPGRALEAPTRAQGKRILVVDDNEDAAELLTQILRARGHEVTAAHEPLEALAAFSALRPSVAIMDIGMPVMDGHELALRIRALPFGGECRLIALTGYGQPHDRKRSADAGFDVHLVKPVDIAGLLRAVTET